MLKKLFYIIGIIGVVYLAKVSVHKTESNAAEIKPETDNAKKAIVENAIDRLSSTAPKEAPAGEAASSTAPATQATLATATVPALSAAAPEQRAKVTEYTVQNGDVAGTIARKFGLKTATVLSANNLTEKSMIRPGDKLKIPSADGMLYTVRSGDTMSKLASSFGVDAKAVAAANGISESGPLKIGDLLILPGAKAVPVQTAVKKTGTASRAVSKSSPKPRAADSSAGSQISGGIAWTSGALNELRRAPAYLRPSVKAKINAYAKSHGIRTITAQVYKSLRI